MQFVVCLLLLVSAAMAADMGMNVAGDSYNFGYNTGDAGSHSRSESGHGGSVTGSYSYIDANGDRRTVSYTAGEDGFKAFGDTGVDRKTAAEAAALAALAPKAPVAPVPAPAPVHAPVAPALHGWYGAPHWYHHHAHPAYVNVHPGGYVASW